MKKVKSLSELDTLARKDSRYEKLAIAAAENLGGQPKNLDEALRHLRNEGNELEHPQAIVDEVNFCIDVM